jgi:TRAP-type C4-dicarboxylate transport system substrate-binding protein
MHGAGIEGASGEPNCITKKENGHMREKGRLLAWVVWVLSGILGMGMTIGAAWADPIVIKYADPSKAGQARTRAAEETMLEIEKRSNGRIKHEFYWSESLLKAKDVLKGVQGGTCDAGDTTAIQYHPARFPVWQFIQIPFITGDDAYAVTSANNELYDVNAQLRQEFEKQGVVLLSTSSLTPTVILSTKSIQKQADFKGLRIRAIGGMAKWAAFRFPFRSTK